MKSDLFKGRYLFHLHTVVTDGKLEFADYFQWVREHKVDRLIFLEHIRRDPDYNVSQFIDELKAHSTKNAFPAHIGFEAKVLPGGSLDISDGHIYEAEVIGMAEHGFPDDFNLWQNSVTTALNRYTELLDEKHLVWVHPGLWLKKKRLLKKYENVYIDLLQKAVDLGWSIEHNYRYGLMPPEINRKFSGNRYRVVGADAHRSEDLERWLQNFNEETY